MAEGCLLYYITDRRQFPGDESAQCRALLAKIVEAARGGVDYIQLREKDLPSRELEALAKTAIQMVREQRTANNLRPATRLLINSRTDVAMAVGADGVHLRSDDVQPADVRSIWAQVQERGGQDRESPLVAVSCHTLADVARIESDGADFDVFGPLFEKGGSETAGLAALRQACKARVPVLALGGVTLENVRACLATGASGIAAIRLFQENPVMATAQCLRGSAANLNS